MEMAYTCLKLNLWQRTIMNESDDENIIESTRLLLEPILSEHATRLFSTLSDPKIYTFLPQDPPQDIQDLEEKYSRWQSRRSPDEQEKWLNWAVFSKDIEIYLGTIQATIYPNGVSALAYELASEFWGYGYAAEACSAVIPILFSSYGVKTIKAEVDTRNLSSQKLLIRLGFNQCDFKKNADSFKGQSSDEFTYVCISLKMAGEWPVLGRQVAFNVAGCEGVGYF